MSKLVIFNNGMRGVDTDNASMTEEGVLKVQKIKTTGIPTEDNVDQYIGWNLTQNIPALGSDIPSDGTETFKRLGDPVLLSSGVYYLRGQVSIDPNGNEFFYSATIKEVSGNVLSTNRHKIWDILGWII